MASKIPSYAICTQICHETSDKECLSSDEIGWMVGERWHEALRGSQDLANVLLAEWDMATRSSLESGGKQVFLYTAPCLHCIEVALSISMGRASATAAIFQLEMEKGLPFYSLPCKIRVDDRLSDHEGCGLGFRRQRMKALGEYLKACANDEVQIPQMELAMLTQLHSGPWLAKHFDLAYIDRRLYDMDTAKETPASKSFTMQTVVNATSNSQTMSTGNLVICGGKAIGSFARGSTNEDGLDLKPDTGRLFQLMPHGADWTVTYYGNFPTSRPPISRTDRIRQEQEEREQREHDNVDWTNLENAVKITGKAVAKRAWGKFQEMRANRK